MTKKNRKKVKAALTLAVGVAIWLEELAKTLAGKGGKSNA